jgi:hypothetical protein
MRIYDFVKEHVIPFNAVILMSITVAAVLDFLAPQAAYLAWVSYALAGLVLTVMVLEVLHQRAAVGGNSLSARLLGRLRSPPGPLWKSPAWQVIGVIAVIALVVGYASKARAADGGLIASSAPNLRNVQVLLLGLQQDTRRIQTTLDGMAPKVDSIQASVGGMEAAMMKSPLEYLSEGDYPFLQKHVASGKKLPQSMSSLVFGLNQKRDDRFDLLELYIRHGFDLTQPISIILSYGIDDIPTINNMRKLNAWTQKRIQQDASMLFYSCKTMDLMIYATVAGDRPLADWLAQKGLSTVTQYPCEFPGTRWTMTIKELQTILSNPVVATK